MPLYVWKCPSCQTTKTVFAKIAERDNFVECGKACQNGMVRQIAAPRVVGDYEGYESPATGKWIEGRRAHLEDLAASGCRILEPGETREFQRRKAQEDEAFFDRVAESAAREVSTWSSEKQAALGKALETSDISYTRSTPN